MSMRLQSGDSSTLKLSSIELQTAASQNEKARPLAYSLFHSCLLYYGVLITPNYIFIPGLQPTANSK